MLLRNYHNMLAAFVLGSRSTNALNFADGYLTVKRMGDGTIFNLDLANGTYRHPATMLALGRPTADVLGNVSTSSYAPRILFGTGTEAVTYDDYKLENECLKISKSSFVVTEPVYDASEKKYTSTTSFVLTNNGADTVTLKEMGIAMGMRVHNGDELVLVYREVLDTPITIAASDSVKYTHTFEFTMPTIG